MTELNEELRKAIWNDYDAHRRSCVLCKDTVTPISGERDYVALDADVSHAIESCEKTVASFLEKARKRLKSPAFETLIRVKMIAIMEGRADITSLIRELHQEFDAVLGGGKE